MTVGVIHAPEVIVVVVLIGEQDVVIVMQKDNNVTMIATLNIQNVIKIVPIQLIMD
jgi:hypothetical protein